MAEMRATHRIELAAAGLLGFGGVAASAAGAHMAADSGLLGTAGIICLTHAAAVLALATGSRGGFLQHLAALALFAGAALFSADVALLAFGHDRLFPMAAPTGGVTMMAGWLVLVLAALLPQRSRKG